MKYIIAALCSLLILSSAVAAKKELTAATHSKQLLIVTSSNWNASTGSLQRFERSNAKQPWQAIGQPMKVALGQQGTAWNALVAKPNDGPVKKEGDARTPAGIFPINSAFGFGPGYIKKIKMPYNELTTNSICVTDSQSQYYNRIINANKISKKDWQTAESLREIPQNRWGLVIGYNTKKPVTGAGSCAVINVWKSPSQSTQGGVAVAENNMEELITWLNPAKKPLIVILPKQQYVALKQAWELPNQLL